MKKVILFILFTVISLPVITAQNNQVKHNPVGTWKFEAPYAPEGYNSGTFVFGLAEQKHTVTIGITGSEDKISGERVKVENDSLSFEVYLEGEIITIRLKLENELKMTGIAVYSEGEVPLTLTKNMASEAEVKK